MKRLRLEHVLAWLLLVIMGLIVVHAPLTVFIESRWPGVADIAKAWKELLLLASLLLLCVKITLSKQWGRFIYDKLLWLIGGYALLHIVMTAFGQATTMAAVAGLMIDLRYVAFFAAVYVFLRLYPGYIESFYHVATVGAVIVLGFALLQQVLPRDFLQYVGYSESTIQPYLTVDENPDYVRHSSTLRGPNPLGAYAVMVVAGVVAYGMKFGRTVKNAKVKYLHLFLAIGAVVALITSHSRSAWIAAVGTVLLLVAVRYYSAFTGRMAAWLVLAAVVLAAGVYAIKDTSFFHNVVLHDNPTTGADIDSNSGHLESLIDGTAKMLASPLGSGVGSTGSASLYGDAPVIIENQYLFTAHEVGWLGLGLFVVIFTIIMIRLWKLRLSWKALAVFASGAGLAVIGLLLPVWVDDTVSIIWWGLAAVVLVEGGMRGKTTNQKQKELLSFIDGFIKGNGYGPSYREIMRALDYRSVSTVATHVNGLIARGWLIKKDNSARTLEVVAPSESDSPKPSVAASAKTAEQEIRAKLDELKQDNEANADDITALTEALRILGYHPTDTIT